MNFNPDQRDTSSEETKRRQETQAELDAISSMAQSVNSHVTEAVRNGKFGPTHELFRNMMFRVAELEKRHGNGR